MINAIKQGCAKNPAEIAMYSWAIYKDAPFEDEQQIIKEHYKQALENISEKINANGVR